jgi:3-phenylpropionate/cinnamic acid dioxygenase small subunit
MTAPKTRYRVEDLLSDYAMIIDDDRLEEWPGLFAEECHYRVCTAADYEEGLPLGMIWADSRAMLVDRIASLREANIYEAHRYRHVTGACRIEEFDGAIARVRSSFAVIRIMHDGDTDLFASGVYRDRIDLSGAPPLFQERIVVLDSQKIDTLLAIPL